MGGSNKVRPDWNKICKSYPINEGRTLYPKSSGNTVAIYNTSLRQVALRHPQAEQHSQADRMV